MKYAGLFGLDGNPWAVSAGFKPTQAEIARLVKLVQGKDIGGESITLCGAKYMFRSPADDGLLTVLSLGGDEKFVCNVCLSTRGVVVGVALASSAGASREYLDKYKNYLKGIGYWYRPPVNSSSLYDTHELCVYVDCIIFCCARYKLYLWCHRLPSVFVTYCNSAIKTTTKHCRYMNAEKKVVYSHFIFSLSTKQIFFLDNLKTCKSKYSFLYNLSAFFVYHDIA